MKQSTIILGVIGADCHAVGNKILERILSDADFNVVNLGVMVSQDEYINAAIETGAEAILISSLYGHGEIDCLNFRENCIERGLEDIIIYVGGNLVVGKTPREEVIAKFEKMGFNRVFPADSDLDLMIEYLQKDIENKRLQHGQAAEF